MEPLEVLLAAHRSIRLRNFLGEGEHQPERVLGDRLFVCARLVANDDPCLVAVSDVDGVVAGTKGANG